MFLQEGFFAIDLEADESPDALQFGEFFFELRPVGLGVCQGSDGEEQEQASASEHDGLLRWGERGSPAIIKGIGVAREITVRRQIRKEGHAFSSSAERPRSAAGAAEEPMTLEKPTCGPGLLQRMVRRRHRSARPTQATARPA